MNFEKIKENITYKLINKKKNDFPMYDIPHTDFLDLTFVYFIVVKKDDYAIDTILVRNNYLKEWGISKEKLHELSKRNFNSIFNIQIWMSSPEDKFIMITTKYKLFGAVFMADAKLLEGFCDALDGDLCILPSSIHEIMIVPAKGLDRQKVDQIIRQVNRETVRRQDYLSDHMYLFSEAEGQIVF